MLQTFTCKSPRYPVVVQNNRPGATFFKDFTSTLHHISRGAYNWSMQQQLQWLKLWNSLNLRASQTENQQTASQPNDKNRKN